MTPLIPATLSSTIVDLAVARYVKIEETVDTTPHLSFKDYILHSLKAFHPEWQGLAPHERVMMGKYFAGGQETKLST